MSLRARESSDKHDAQAAQLLRDAVEDAGGRLVVASATVLALFGARALDGPTSDRITAELAREGVVVEPELVRASQSGDVELGLAEKQVGTRDAPPPEQAVPPASPVPAADPAAVVAAQAAALPPSAVTAGVLVPGLLASLIGFVAWWGYGLVFLVFTGLVWFAVTRARYWFARIFLWPLRSTVAAGLLLGLIPVLFVLTVAGLFVAAPLAAKRSSDAQQERAARLIARANRALDGRDLRRARQALSQVGSSERTSSSYRDAADRASALQAENERERERRAAYVRAEEDFDTGDFAAAVQTLRELGDYRDAPALATRYARQGANDLGSDASKALGDRRWTTAISLAEESLALHPTDRARRIRTAARRGLDAARARAKARARARARARRAAARRRAEQRAIARRDRAARRRERARQQQQQEFEVPSVPETSGGGGGAIICEDGYVWPGTTRQGACNGHGGIAG